MSERLLPGGRWPVEPLPDGYRLLRSEKQRTHVIRASEAVLGPPWSPLCSLSLTRGRARLLDAGAEVVDPCAQCALLLNWTTSRPRPSRSVPH